MPTQKIKTEVNPYLKVSDLIAEGVIYKPIDGNHGERHPKGDDFVDSGIPFIMASDIINGSIDVKNCKYITEEKANTLQKGFAINGDVLLSHKATIGRTAIVDTIHEYIVLSPQVTYYRIKDGSRLSNIFLKYYFDSYVFQKTLSNYAGSGSTRAYIGITKQKDLPIYFPPLPEQRAIAAVLSSLDDKIELLRKQNETLEELAQTLFKRWFVDFNFPYNFKTGKVDLENGQPYKDNGGKMVESELGEIPEGWELHLLEDIFSFVKGKKPKQLSETKEGNLLPQILIDVLDGATPSYASPDGAVVAEESSVIMVMDGASSGRVEFGYSGVIGSTLALLESKKQVDNILYLFLKSKERDIQENTTGSAIPHTDKSRVYSYQIALPNNISVFENSFGSYLKKILLNRKQIKTLTNLRDTLLPRLMSGEVRVKY